MRYNRVGYQRWPSTSRLSVKRLTNFYCLQDLLGFDRLIAVIHAMGQNSQS